MASILTYVSVGVCNTWEPVHFLNVGSTNYFYDNFNIFRLRFVTFTADYVS